MPVKTPTIPKVQQPQLERALAGRPDALPIAQAAVRHMKGDLWGALECLTSVAPELETADLLKSRGYIQIELKDYASAAKSYEGAVGKQGDSAENWFQWGFCLQKLGQSAEALPRFEKAAALGSDWIEVPLARSICHLGLKQYAQAIERADECLSRESAYVPALFSKAVVLHLTWELDKASEVYRTLLGHNPKFIQARMNLVTAGMQQKNYDAILRESLALLELEPANLLALEGTALVAFTRNQLEEARNTYQRLTELAPTQAEYWLNLGVTLRKLEKTADAVAPFQKAREIRPDSVSAHTHLAEALWKSDDLTGARICYEEALAKWPERDELALSLAHLLGELNNLEAAEQVCVNYCRRTPSKPQVWFQLGFVQWQRTEINQAVESFNRAVELQPIWPDAEVNLALVCFAAGQIDRADKILLALVEREPDHLEALRGLATIALHRHEEERALHLHVQLLELGERTSEIYFNCGVLAQHLNRLEDAARYYRDAIEVRQDFAEALLNLGHTLQSIGEGEEAKAFWIPALELNPGFALDYFRRR